MKVPYRERSPEGESRAPQISTDSYRLAAKAPNNLIKKGAKELNSCFSKKDIQMANRKDACMKRYLLLLIMQVKTRMRYSLGTC